MAAPRPGETTPDRRHVPGLDRPVLMARVGAAHGVRGEVRVKPFNEDPLALNAFGPLTAADGTRLTIRKLRPQKAMLVVTFAEVTTRAAAEALNGTDLFVDRAVIPEIEDDGDFLIADLEGLAAFDPDGTMLGTVATVVDFGAGDILEIAPPRGKRWMVAFTNANVPDIDLDAGSITIARPPELGDDAPGKG